MSSSKATVTQGTATFEFDAVVWFGCVDAFVRSVVHAPYRFHAVALPNGQYVYHKIWDIQTVTGTLTALTGPFAGTVWTRERNVSETAPTLDVRQVFHISWNANGDPTAQFSKTSCKVM